MSTIGRKIGGKSGLDGDRVRLTTDDGTQAQRYLVQVVMLTLNLANNPALLLTELTRELQTQLQETGLPECQPKHSREAQVSAVLY